MAAVLALTTTACSAAYHVSGLDCLSDPTEQMANRAKEEKILDRPPPNTLPITEEYTSLACEDDNSIAEVGRRYRFTSPPATISSHYEKEASATGWRLIRDGKKDVNKRLGSKEDWPSDTCYIKDLGDFDANLELSFDYWSDDVEKDPSTKTYWLEISFSPDGGNCQSTNSSGK
ncbi:hypothetical protein [Streptosporangium sp. LJ11]|uniref:hypothetical protein n=1 Tax=Streptosporangium sp. LJ11 TaxID=3436927 RepID=UPI003F7A156A